MDTRALADALTRVSTTVATAPARGVSARGSAPHLRAVGAQTEAGATWLSAILRATSAFLIQRNINSARPNRCILFDETFLDQSRKELFD